MSKPELIKKSGWAFIAGAFAFITILSGSDPIAIPGSVVSAIGSQCNPVGSWDVRFADGL